MSVAGPALIRSSLVRMKRATIRSVVVAAKETTALVLDEEASVPESDQDVVDLVLRLRGHLMQLGPAADASPGSLADALTVAQRLAAQEVPNSFMQSLVYLRNLTLRVQEVLVEMGKAGLACMHQPECPPAHDPASEAAQVLARCPSGYSLLCNGLLAFEDTGCLMPSGQIIPPRRPLPMVAVAPPEVGQ